MDFLGKVFVSCIEDKRYHVSDKKYNTGCLLFDGKYTKYLSSALLKDLLRTVMEHFYITTTSDCDAKKRF